MSTRAVIGLGFGDEGKGVTTEYLCAQDPANTIVVRFSGGHQAGHKVIKGNVEHIFSSFGAGTLSGCPTYWSKNCTFEPVAFCKEYLALRKKGIQPTVYIHPHCPVTTIYDVFANRSSIEVEHGTTGTGFFRTRKRHFVDGLKLQVADLWKMFAIRRRGRLEEIKKYYNIKEELREELFDEAVKMVQSLFAEGRINITPNIPDYKNIVFEGSQGLMLDEHIGYMPHCTPSDVTPKAILDLGHKLDEVYLVTRAYQTRHGNGPMTNEQFPTMQLKNNEKETNVDHKYQGKFRTTILDLDQLIHAKTNGIDAVVPKSTKVNLVITCMDQLSEYPLTYNGGHVKMVFTHRDSFAHYIMKSLNINGDLYINDSPESNLTRIEK